MRRLPGDPNPARVFVVVSQQALAVFVDSNEISPLSLVCTCVRHAPRLRGTDAGGEPLVLCKA
jgi:hypothetical protein